MKTSVQRRITPSNTNTNVYLDVVKLEVTIKKIILRTLAFLLKNIELRYVLCLRLAASAIKLGKKEEFIENLCSHMVYDNKLHRSNN